MRMPHVTQRVHMCVCVCVHICVINENKHSFQDFWYLISHTLLVESPLFSLCGTIFLCFYVEVTWRNVEHPITQLIVIVNLHLSEGVHGALWLGDDLFYDILISAIDLRSYNGWD